MNMLQYSVEIHSVLLWYTNKERSDRMKQPAKRILSAVLVVLLCISLLSGLSFAATVNYQTGNPEGFSNVILNWGQRGTTSTFLF